MGWWRYSYLATVLAMDKRTGTLSVRYPDEGKNGVIDDALTADWIQPMAAAATPPRARASILATNAPPQAADNAAITAGGGGCSTGTALLTFSTGAGNVSPSVRRNSGRSTGAFPYNP